jgi:hypothetical protein
LNELLSGEVVAEADVAASIQKGDEKIVFKTVCREIQEKTGWLEMQGCK